MLIINIFLKNVKTIETLT